MKTAIKNLMDFPLLFQEALKEQLEAGNSEDPEMCIGEGRNTGGFDWYNTDQGNEFFNAIYDALECDNTLLLKGMNTQLFLSNLVGNGRPFCYYKNADDDLGVIMATAGTLKAYNFTEKQFMLLSEIDTDRVQESKKMKNNEYLDIVLETIHTLKDDIEILEIFIKLTVTINCFTSNDMRILSGKEELEFFEF